MKNGALTDITTKNKNQHVKQGWVDKTGDVTQRGAGSRMSARKGGGGGENRWAGDDATGVGPRCLFVVVLCRSNNISNISWR